MTRTTNARIAGFTFLAYIAAGITSMVVFGRATSGEGIAARLAAMAHHTTDIGVVILLGWVQCLAALILAVTLYAITRVQDPDLAMLAMICRAGEGLVGALSMPSTLAALRLATAAGANVPDTAAANVLGAYLLHGDMAFTATFFAVGSALFSWLLLRGRMIPVPLAWLGVAASILLVVGLPLQLAGFVGGPITRIWWLPMFLFEVPLALWLLFKGVAAPQTR